MRITNEQYQAILARQASRKGAGPRPVVQEQQNADTGSPDHESQEAEMDGGGSRKFAVTIEILVSDKRDRDLDGAATTLLDVYLLAIGRLGGLDRTNLRSFAKNRQRK